MYIFFNYKVKTQLIIFQHLLDVRNINYGQNINTNYRFIL